MRGQSIKSPLVIAVVADKLLAAMGCCNCTNRRHTTLDLFSGGKRVVNERKRSERGIG